MSLMSRATTTALKISSSDPDVRHRALANLLTKCQSQLVTPGELASISFPSTNALGGEEKSSEANFGRVSFPMELAQCVEKLALEPNDDHSASVPQTDCFVESDLDNALHLLCLILDDPSSPLSAIRPSVALLRELEEKLPKNDFLTKIFNWKNQAVVLPRAPRPFIAPNQSAVAGLVSPTSPVTTPPTTASADASYLIQQQEEGEQQKKLRPNYRGKEEFLDTPDYRMLLGWNSETTDLLYGGWCFPDVKLCMGDEKQLLDLEVRLGLKHDTAEILASLETLQNHIAFDFPPEVILQRGSILLRILELIKSPEDSTTSPALATVLTILLRLTSSLKNIHCNANITGGHEDAYAMQLGEDQDQSQQHQQPKVADNIRSFRYPKATSASNNANRTPSEFTNMSPLNGKGKLSVGGAAYVMHRAASSSVRHNNPIAVQICKLSFSLMQEPFISSDGSLTFLGAARVSSALVPLTYSAIVALNSHCLTESVLKSYIGTNKSTLPISLLLAIEHVNSLPASLIMVDAYGAKKTDERNVMNDNIDTIPPSARLSPPKATIPAPLADAIVTLGASSPHFRASNPDLSRQSAAAAVALNLKTAEIFAKAEQLVMSATPALSFLTAGCMDGSATTSSSSSDSSELLKFCVDSSKALMTASVLLSETEVSNYSAVSSYIWAATCFLMENCQFEVESNNSILMDVSMPLLKALRNRKQDAFSNLNLLLGGNQGRDTAISPTLKVDATGNFLHAPEVLVGLVPKNLVSIRMSDVNRCCAGVGFLASNCSAASEMLHTFLTSGLVMEGEDRSAVKDSLAAILEHVKDDKTALALANSATLIQLEVFQSVTDFTRDLHGEFGSALSLTESLTDELTALMIDIQGLFHRSNDVRHISSKSLWSNVSLNGNRSTSSHMPDPAASLISDGWERNFLDLEKLQKIASVGVVGLTANDIHNLFALVSESNIKDGKDTIGNLEEGSVVVAAAEQLADALLEDPYAISLVSNSNFGETAASSFLTALAHLSHINTPHNALHAFSKLFRSLIWTSEFVRQVAVEESEALTSDMLGMMFHPNEHIRNSILAGYHRLAFDPCNFMSANGREGTCVNEDLHYAAYVEAEHSNKKDVSAVICKKVCSAICTPMHPKVKETFSVPSGFYFTTLKGFCLDEKSDSCGRSDADSDDFTDAVKLSLDAKIKAANNTEDMYDCINAANVANGLSMRLANSKSIKEMMSNIEECHSACLTLPGVSACFSRSNSIHTALHRILAVAPSSAKDHDLLSSTLRLLKDLLPNFSFATFCVIFESMSRTAMVLLDSNVLSPSLASDGLDINGIRKSKDTYGGGFSSGEKRRFKKKAARALASLWAARHEMLKFLISCISSPLASVMGEDVDGTPAVHLVLKGGLCKMLVDRYLSAVSSISSSSSSSLPSPAAHVTTCRSIEGVFGLLMRLVEKGDCCREFRKENGLFEQILPKLISIVRSTQVPDSFTQKCKIRNAVIMLRVLAANCLVDSEVERQESIEESSLRQQRQRDGWGGADCDTFSWIMKVLCDRENSTRACGYGICSDLMQLAWARPLVLTLNDRSESAHFHTSILEMSCRVGSDDSESPIVRSECLYLLSNACCFGGGVLDDACTTVLEVIPAVGRMLSRTSRVIDDERNVRCRDHDDDSTTLGDAEVADLKDPRLDFSRNDDMLLAPPVLLRAGVKLLRSLLAVSLSTSSPLDESKLDMTLNVTDTDLGSSIGDSEDEPPTPDQSMESSFSQDELATHFYNSGILSHCISLLDFDGLKDITTRATVAHLGLKNDNFALSGWGGEAVKSLWDDLNSGTAHDIRTIVYDLANLAIYIDGEGDKGNNVCVNLLRHTPVLAHTLRTLTTEVNYAVELGRNGRGMVKEQVKCFGSCCRFLSKLFESSVVEVDEESGVIQRLSPLMPGGDSLPRALGMSLRKLCLLSVSVYNDAYLGVGNYIMDDCCRNVNNLFSVMLNLPNPWRDGCLTGKGLSEGDGEESVLGGLLQLHHSRGLKGSNAANIPVQNRMNCLTSVDGDVLRVTDRIAAACALAAAFDAAREGGDDVLTRQGNIIARLAIPDLLSELNDCCALIALDCLRDKDGGLLERGKRNDVKRGLKDGSKAYKINQGLGTDLMVGLLVVRSAVRLEGGKVAAREGIAGGNLVSFILKIWPIALSCEFDKREKGKPPLRLMNQSMLEILLGVIGNFCSGDLESKKSLCGSSGASSPELRLSERGLVNRIVMLALKRSGGSVSVRGSVVGLAFGCLRSLALPPSPSRGSLAVSGLYVKSICSLRTGLRMGGGMGSPRGRGNDTVWNERVGGVLKLMINASLDAEGRNAVLRDGFADGIGDLIQCAERGTIRPGLVKDLLLLIRNVCLDKTHKSVVLNNSNWIDFVLVRCGSSDRGIRKCALSALWIFLYRSEKAVSCIKNNERFLGLLISAEGVAGQAQGSHRDDDISRDVMKCIQMLMSERKTWEE